MVVTGVLYPKLSRTNSVPVSHKANILVFSAWCSGLLLLQGVSELPDYGKIVFNKSPPVPLEQLVPEAADVALELLKQFLIYPSKQRIAASKVGHAEVDSIQIPFLVDNSSSYICLFRPIYISK